MGSGDGRTIFTGTLSLRDTWDTFILHVDGNLHIYICMYIYVHEALYRSYQHPPSLFRCICFSEIIYIKVCVFEMESQKLLFYRAVKMCTLLSEQVCLYGLLKSRSNLEFSRKTGLHKIAIIFLRRMCLKCSQNPW